MTNETLALFSQLIDGTQFTVSSNELEEMATKIATARQEIKDEFARNEKAVKNART